MPLRSEEQWGRLVEELRQSPGLTVQLPDLEGDIVREALEGQDVHTIAINHRTTEETVWAVMGRAAQAAAGRSPVQRPETGGLGSDIDPGVSGGYGDTGFGSLGNEPPMPNPEEPPDQELS